MRLIIREPGFVIACLIVCAFFGSGIAKAQTAPQLEQQLNRLIKTYWHPPVNINGIETTVFDYEAMKEDADGNDALFTQIRANLAAFDPETIQDENTAKAFWINAYNFGAMQLIVDHYPVDSIRSFKISLLKHPWSKKIVRIGGRSYSLTEIEKDILLKRYDDPRILFAVSCAAISCPDRLPYAFSGSELDRQLDTMISNFFTNSGKGFALDENAATVRLSWILKKDQSYFVGPDADQQALLEFVKPYISEKHRRRLKHYPVEIRFLDHDWTLNDLKQAD